MSANVSHGRGGAANIRPDDTPYTDGEIVREGPVGDQGDGAYSAGRGGTGNIDRTPRSSGDVLAHDHDYVPEVATRLEPEDSHHFGRGGAGNEVHTHKHKVNADGEAPHENLVDKVKHIFNGKK